MTSTSKRVLVIGGTGAQGFAVVQALIEEHYTIRVLSRNPDSPYVKATFADLPQVEFVKGSFLDFDTVEQALQDCYGVYVNTDGFTVKESDELWAGVRIFEIANTVPTLRHFVYAGIDYYLQLTSFDHKYATHHTNGKGRVNAYLQSQKSSVFDDSLTWTVINTGVYNEDILGGPLAPQIAPDGTVHFRLPLGEPSGSIPFATLRDTGVFAAKVFASRERWSGQTLNTASHFSTGPEIAEAFTKASGIKAVYENVSIQEWEEVNLAGRADGPLASTDPGGITIAENFRMWWSGFQDSILLEKGTRDFELLKEVHPDLETMEGWMRRVRYDGKSKAVLKGWVDAGIGPKPSYN